MNTRIRKFGLTVLLMSTHAFAVAAPYLFSFSGVVSNFDSYNPNYSVGDLDVVLGVTPVSYLFEVDFGRNVSTYTNSAATWNYFFCDLIGDGFAFSKLGGLSGENQSGFNAQFFSPPNIGELDGGSTVRIFTTSYASPNWEVNNWQIGQSFQFTDGTTVPGESGAIYVLGNVTLDSITIIPEPSAYSAFAALFVFGFVFGNKRYRK